MRLAWTHKDETVLRIMYEDGAVPEAIALRLGRSVESVTRKARYLNLNKAEVKPLIRLPPLELGQCTWIEGERPNWTRCQNRTWRETDWCEEHYRATHTRGYHAHTDE